MNDVVLTLRRLFLCAALLVLAGCETGPANLVGLGEDQFPFAEEKGATVQTLYFATTRGRSEDAAEYFSGERSEVMALGKLDATIPPDHQIGHIERPTFEDIDIAKNFTIARPMLFENSASFRTDLNQALEQRPVGERSVLVFVHGYNTNFSDAVLRVSQFVHDTDFKGVTVLFTWASRRRALDYVYDLNSVLQARFYLVELATVLAESEAESFSLVAHSMGNLLTLEAMVVLQEKNFTTKAPLTSVVLAAPDVDFDLFVQYMRVLGPTREKLAVLVSLDDDALSFSRRIAGGIDRVGDADPTALAALGVRVLDLSQISDESSANHSKFADSPEIVQLIGRGINAGNTLSSEQINPTETVVGSVFRQFVKIPSRLLGGPQGAVLTVGN